MIGIIFWALAILIAILVIVAIFRALGFLLKLGLVLLFCYFLVKALKYSGVVLF